MAEVLFIVPAYNEESSLPGVLSDLRLHQPAADVVVVNDGSTDRTAAVARAHGAMLLDLPVNLGIGGAVQTGLIYAVRQGYRVAVQFDGDGQHRADQVASLLDPLLRGECDVVIGSRFVRAGSYRAPLMRRCGIAIFRMVNSLLIGQAIHDNTSGFRAYNRAALAFLAADYPDDYPEPESVVTLARNGFRLREVPVLMRERQGGRSSITFARAIFYMGKVLLAILIGATRRKTRREGDESAHPAHLNTR
ncbi:MAG: glycosyltransferase family 2 protein [Chloroflexia bacterium]